MGCIGASASGPSPSSSGASDALLSVLWDSRVSLLRASRALPVFWREGKSTESPHSSSQPHIHHHLPGTSLPCTCHFRRARNCFIRSFGRAFVLLGRGCCSQGCSRASGLESRRLGRGHSGVRGCHQALGPRERLWALHRQHSAR